MKKNENRIYHKIANRTFHRPVGNITLYGEIPFAFQVHKGVFTAGIIDLEWEILKELKGDVNAKRFFS